MTGLRGKISKNLAILVFASFLFLSVFGVSIGVEMENGQMSPCPFMASQAAICQMSVTEHISKWQQSFLGIPAKNNFLILALLFFAFVAGLFIRLISQIKQFEIKTRFLSYLKETANKIFAPLLLAFSDGILNPKIYEPAHN